MPLDLDEIQPDRFVIHNDKLRPLLRGEGVTAGRFFELVTWRRDGLIARLRMRGFEIRTIADRIAALPGLPDVAPPGELGVRALASNKERYAMFDEATLRWRELSVETIDGQAAVRVHDNVALRRRKGRGKGDYYLSALVRGAQINLLPRTETDALLHAYAQLGRRGSQPQIAAVRRVDGMFVDRRQLTLPTPHSDALLLLAHGKAEAWTFPKAALGLAGEVFAKLGIQLHFSNS